MQKMLRVATRTLHSNVKWSRFNILPWKYHSIYKRHINLNHVNSTRGYSSKLTAAKALKTNRTRLRNRGPGAFGLLNRVNPPSTNELIRAQQRGSKRQVIARDQKSISNKRRSLSAKSFNRRGKVAGSSHPLKALKMHQSLTEISYGTRNKIKQDISGIASFNQFHQMSPVVREAISEYALHGIKDPIPTPIQRLSIPVLLESDVAQQRSVLLAAETGSGKTLAYLLPIIHHVKAQVARHAVVAQSERHDLDLELPDFRALDVGRPHAVILVPSAELVDQVTSVAKLLCHRVKFCVQGISSVYSAKVIRNRVFHVSGVDILISTPYLLGSIVKGSPNILSEVKYLVLDEADTLLDRSFINLIEPFLKPGACPKLQQLVFCSATIPQGVDKFIRSRYPNTIRLATPNLHAIPRRVQLSVVDATKAPFHGNKDLACADLIWNLATSGLSNETTECASDSKKILVFVNEREKCVELANYLQEKGIDALALNRDARDGKFARDALLNSFSGNRNSRRKRDITVEQTRNNSISAPQCPAKLKGAQVLVVTDLASRGIDTISVRRVIIYDVPRSSINFIHRLGRTGRMNRRGYGYVILGKKDRREIVSDVRRGMFLGRALI